MGRIDLVEMCEKKDQFRKQIYTTLDTRKKPPYFLQLTLWISPARLIVEIWRTTKYDRLLRCVHCSNVGWTAQDAGFPRSIQIKQMKTLILMSTE